MKEITRNGEGRNDVTARALLAEERNDVTARARLAGDDGVGYGADNTGWKNGGGNCDCNTCP